MDNTTQIKELTKQADGSVQLVIKHGKGGIITTVKIPSNTNPTTNVTVIQGNRNYIKLDSNKW